MAQTSTYLMFGGNCEQAFTYYRQVFGGEFMTDPIRMSDAPPMEGQPDTTGDWAGKIMNIALMITGDHMLMGSDSPETVEFGNNVFISLHPDTRAEADRLHAALSEGGEVYSAMTEEFWGDYFGTLKDQFGVQWMINTEAKA